VSRWHDAATTNGSLLSVSALMMGLTGCGAGSPAYRASAGVAINREAFQGTGLKPGIELGWDNRLYQLVTTVGPTKAGRRLIEALYHGTLGHGLLHCTRGLGIPPPMALPLK